jgi:hypothetical protein
MKAWLSGVEVESCTTIDVTAVVVDSPICEEVHE